MRGGAPPGMFTPRWEELQQTYGIERPRGLPCEIFIHRVPQDYGIFPMPYERIVITPDLWPDEVIDDITAWYEDLRGTWPEEEWCHPQLHTTVLPQLLNMPILRTFLAPLLGGIQTSLTLRAFLNGVALNHQLVSVESGFYLRVHLEGSPHLVSQMVAISHTQQLHRHPTIITGGYTHNRGTTVYIPGGNRLTLCRKINLIGPNLEQDVEATLRRRFPDLAQDNFGTGLVHRSYYLTEPVADPGWDIRLVIPVVEDDITPVVLFKAVLSTYEGLGAIYVPLYLNKQILIKETGLDIVCGPQGELCICYHNGLQLGLTQLEVADLDYISCWLVEGDTVPDAPEVRVTACAGRGQPRRGYSAWASS